MHIHTSKYRNRRICSVLCSTCSCNDILYLFINDLIYCFTNLINNYTFLAFILVNLIKKLVFFVSKYKFHILQSLFITHLLPLKV